MSYTFAPQTSLTANPPNNLDRVFEDQYHIRLSDTEEGRSSAIMLVNKMYTWRGYECAHQFADDPNRITLIATDKGEDIGTLTIGLDSPSGLGADQIFKDEIDPYRVSGKVCEFTKLAFNGEGRSQNHLANLFHLALLITYDIHQCTVLFIEVNPRHRRFYERMLGFERIGALRLNQRVNAPAILLSIHLDYVNAQVKKYGGTFGSSDADRTFYRFFFAPADARGILKRLLDMNEQLGA